MSKRERLHLSRYQSIETYRDWNGRLFIACSSNCSMIFRDAKALRKWLNLPLKTPSREAFDSWIASLEAADAQRKGDTVKPVGDANVEGSFDPLAHKLDESDPQFQTRTVI